MDIENPPDIVTQLMLDTAQYITIKNRADGFAYFDTILSEKDNLVDGEYYKTTIYGWDDGKDGKYSVDTMMSSNRYYLNEKDAVSVDKAYQAASGLNMTYALVSVKNGKMLLKGLYLYDMPIENFQKLSKTEQDNLYHNARTNTLRAPDEVSFGIGRR